jgi:hypothetical protein
LKLLDDPVAIGAPGPLLVNHQSAASKTGPPSIACRRPVDRDAADFEKGEAFTQQLSRKSKNAFINQYIV